MQDMNRLRGSRAAVWLTFLSSLLVLFAADARFAPDCHAQSSPSDIFVNEDIGEEAAYEPLAGFTGYGANIGLLQMYGSDVTDGAKFRPIMQAAFKYRFSEKWIGLGEFGFAWNSFDTRQDTVLTMNFGTLGVLREFSEMKGFTIRAGGGLGMYRWNYKNNGKSIRDRETQQFYRGFAPGVMLGVEGERRLSRHVTLSGSLQNHYVLAAEDKFDSLFDQNFSAVGFRIGAHYHFSPYEGILWERKENNKIRLPSN